MDTGCAKKEGLVTRSKEARDCVWKLCDVIKSINPEPICKQEEAKPKLPNPIDEVMDNLDDIIRSTQIAIEFFNTQIQNKL